MEGFFNTVIIFGLVVFCASFSTSKESSSFVTKITLTTAKVRGSASPKPTSLYKRIPVEPVQKFSNNMFRVTGPQRRSNKVDNNTVSEWDFWCRLQPKTGNCTEKQKGSKTTRHYYDAQLDVCKTFQFSGCNENQNNFKTLVECERHCAGSICMTFKTPSNKIKCSLQPSSGICMDLVERYYYDVNADACKIFLYGGCNGNENRFYYYTDCIKQCKGLQ